MLQGAGVVSAPDGEALGDPGMNARGRVTVYRNQTDKALDVAGGSSLPPSFDMRTGAESRGTLQNCT